MTLSQDIFNLFFDGHQVSMFTREEIFSALGVIAINISATADEPFDTLDEFIRQLLEWKNDGTLEKTIDTLQKQMREME